MKKAILIYWMTFLGLLLFLGPIQAFLKMSLWHWGLWVVGAILLASVVQMFYEKMRKE